jgi:hypothetical protein
VEEMKVVCYELQGKTFYSIYTDYQRASITYSALAYSGYVKNIRIMENNEFWSQVHAVIRYNRKNSPMTLFEVCMTETDLNEKRISLLFDQEIVNLEVVGGQANVD